MAAKPACRKPARRAIEPPMDLRMPATPPAAPAMQPGRVRARTLVLTRWIAAGGQFATLLVVTEGLHVSLPMVLAMAAVGCSVALNLALTLRGRLGAWHTDREAALYLAYDLLQLTALLYLTGGLKNPFAVLFLVPVTVSATILSLGSTVGLALLAFCCVSLLAQFHMPLPWPDGSLAMPPVYLMGTWVALTLGMSFIIFFAWRVAEEARHMSEALAATQLALAREQALSSLGGLAAAAAHELGTPLGTIALVAKEMSREVPPGSDLAEDVALLQSQAERCRTILARLARNPRDTRDSAFDRMSFPALVAATAEPYRRDGIALEVRTNAEHGVPAPEVSRSPELQQGLGNLIENAVDFARGRVDLQIAWTRSEVRLELTDDGPGFSPEVVGLLGEPYVTTRRQQGGMGLGVFISKTLLERTGATVRFANRRRGRGAMVVVIWARSSIEALARSPLPADGETA